MGHPTVLIGESGGADSSEGDENAEPSISFGIELGWDDLVLSIKKTWLDVEGAVKTWGDKDNHLSLLSGKADIESEAAFSLGKGELEVTPVNASVEGELVEGKLTQTALHGAFKSSETLDVGKVDSNAKITANISKDHAEVGASVGAEAMVIQGTAEGSIRITPKTIYDNTVGRWTGTEASKAWDVGVKLGATGEAGYGVSAKASAGAEINDHEAIVEAKLKIGLGPTLGGDLHFGVVW